MLRFLPPSDIVRIFSKSLIHNSTAGKAMPGSLTPLLENVWGGGGEGVLVRMRFLCAGTDLIKRADYWKGASLDPLFPRRPSPLPLNSPANSKQLNHPPSSVSLVDPHTHTHTLTERQWRRRVFEENRRK